MSITHAIIAAAGISLLLGTAEPMALGLAVLGSQVPDIDTTRSTIGKIFFPISSWLQDRFPHRSITHSLVATFALAAVALPVGFWLGNWLTALAFPLGHLIACFSDCFTKQGVQLFWPDPAWAVSVSNPRRRIETGSPAEYWVLVMATVALVIGIYLATEGGISQKFSQSLGLQDAIIEVYNQNAGTNHVYAQIEGVKASDRSSASGQYFILDTLGKEFVVMDGMGKIYQTGQQLLADRLTATVGDAAQTRVETLTFQDEDIIPVLMQWQQQFPNAAIFLRGNIAVDFPEEIEVPIVTDQLPTLTLSGSNVQLNYCPIEIAIATLTDQYAIGTLQAKIIQPKPTL